MLTNFDPSIDQSVTDVGPKVGKLLIDHFTVVCLVAWLLNENEAEGDLVLIETPLLCLIR